MREMAVFFTEGRLNYDALDDWPVERLYRFVDHFIESHTLYEDE